MSWHRWEARARLEDGMTERRVDGSGLQLVTVCLTDGGARSATSSASRSSGRRCSRTCVRARRASWRSACWSWLSWPSGRRPTMNGREKLTTLTSAPARVRVSAPVLAASAWSATRVDRAPVRACGARGRAGVRARAGRGDRRGPRDLRLGAVGALGVRAADRGGRARARRPGARPGGLAARSQQRRLVPAA